MSEPTLEQMMQYMIQSKKESFYLVIIILTLILVFGLLILFLIRHFLIRSIVLSSIIRVVAILSIVVYSLNVHAAFRRYKKGYVNRSPWYGGIYEGYYECSKCKSLHGGIFGKGPTKHRTVDTECIHDWQAIYKQEFCKKIKTENELTTDQDDNIQ